MSSKEDRRDRLMTRPARPLGQQRAAAAQLQAMLAASAFGRAIPNSVSAQLRALGDAMIAAIEKLHDTRVAAEAWETPIRADRPAPTRVLLVEDSPQTAAMLRQTLTTLGYEVVVAGNGREALQRLESQNVNVVLTDIDMPDMGGIELCETLRGGEATRAIPIIVLSTEGSGTDMRRAAAAGATAYLVKTELTTLGLIAAIQRFALDAGL